MGDGAKRVRTCVDMRALYTQFPEFSSLIDHKECKYRPELVPEQPVELHHGALGIVLAVNGGKFYDPLLGTNDRNEHLDGAAVAAVGTADFRARVADDGNLAELQAPPAPADAEYGLSDDESVTLHLQAAFAEERKQTGQKEGKQPDDSLNSPEQKVDSFFLVTYI